MHTPVHRELQPHKTSRPRNPTRLARVLNCSAQTLFSWCASKPRLRLTVAARYTGGKSAQKRPTYMGRIILCHFAPFLPSFSTTTNTQMCALRNSLITRDRVLSMRDIVKPAVSRNCRWNGSSCAVLGKPLNWVAVCSWGVREANKKQVDHIRTESGGTCQKGRLPICARFGIGLID